MKKETELSTGKRNIILVTLMAGAFIASIGQNMLTAALSSIMVEFQISASLGQLLTTGYIMLLGIISALSAFLIRKYATKNLFLCCMGLFLAGGILAFFAPSFPVLLFGRAIQACGAGVLVPLLQTVAFYLFPKEKHGQAMGIVMLVIGFAPALGPVVSGVFVDLWGWRSIFILMIGVAMTAFALGAVNLCDFSDWEKGRMDLFSTVLYGFGFCGFMLGVTSMKEAGIFAMQTLLLLGGGVLFLGLFIYRQLRERHPMMELRLFGNKEFCIAAILIGLTYMASMSGATIVPLYIQTARGESATLSGLVVLPGMLVSILLSPVAGKLFDQFGARRVTLTGLLILFLGNSGFVFCTENSSLLMVTLLYLIRMFGTTLLLTPLSAYSVSTLEKGQIPQSTAIVTSFRQMVASLATSILVVVISVISAPAAVTAQAVQVSFGIQRVVYLAAIFLAWRQIQK